ncbi:MAG: geranylgeranyl reductase family protein [Thermodesulfobacteriota bacterium]
MKTISCGILVVGAGPAGAAAALAAAKAGGHVILADRRKTIGVPVRCAEYVPAQLIGELNLGKPFVVQSIKGMKTFLPNGETTVTLAKGFMINRDRFDQCLAKAAAGHGAEHMLCTQVVGREADGTIIARHCGDPPVFTRIRASVIIGADGPHSTIGRWVGARNRDLLVGLQVSMPLVHAQDYTEVYFDPEIFGGYGWFFPKKNLVNIGVGMRPAAISGKSPPHVLKTFVQRFLDQKRIGEEVLCRTGGHIPAEARRRAVFGDIILVGDAAGHTHPVTGAGIFSAVTCGEMAGRWAAAAVKKGDRSLLQEYEAEWQDLFGETLQRGHRRRRLLESQWHNLPQIIKQTWVAYREYYA